MKKKGFSPEDFLTRAEKVKKLEFPKSVSERVIVPSNYQGIGFRFDCYPPEILD